MQAKNTPLHYACASGSIKIVDQLVNREGRLDSVNLVMHNISLCTMLTFLSSVNNRRSISPVILAAYQ